MVISFGGGKNYIHNLKSGLTCLRGSGSTNSMIKSKHMNNYNSKLMANKFKYSMTFGPYKTTNDVKVPFSVLYFDIRKLITHCFHIDNAQGDIRIIYDMIIGCHMMV